MTRHELDLFSLLSGLVLTGLAAAALLEPSADVTVWVWPGLLITVGVIVLASVLSPARDDAAASARGDDLPAHHHDAPDRTATMAAARDEVDAVDRTVEVPSATVDASDDQDDDPPPQ